jgi:hypothetical protein
VSCHILYFVSKKIGLVPCICERTPQTLIAVAPFLDLPLEQVIEFCCCFLPVDCIVHLPVTKYCCLNSQTAIIIHFLTRKSITPHYGFNLDDLIPYPILATSNKQNILIPTTASTLPIRKVDTHPTRAEIRALPLLRGCVYLPRLLPCPRFPLLLISGRPFIQDGYPISSSRPPRCRRDLPRLLCPPRPNDS